MLRFGRNLGSRTTHPSCLSTRGGAIGIRTSLASLSQARAMQATSAIGLCDTLDLILLLDRIAVGRLFCAVHDLVSQAFRNPPTLLATIQVIRNIRILDILWYCDPGWTHKSNWIKNIWVRKCQKICPSSAKSICYFSVCHWLPCSSCMLRYAEICWVAWAAWALADYSMANRKIAYTLGRGRAYISDMSSTSGYMGAKYFQKNGPIFFCHVLS